MEGTSPLNNSNNVTNVPDQVPGTTLTSCNPDNSVSAQQQQNAPDDSANHTSRIFTLEEQTRIDREYQALDRILGLTPGAETQIDQDTLMATDMTPATNPLPPNPSIANRSIRQGSVASSQQSTTVSRQQTRTRNATQIENFVDEGEVQALLGLFEDQWSMWTRALEYESPAQARGALKQAAITRNMIRAMRSEEETDELCQYWNPISVLAEMDQEETTTGITDNDHVTVMPHTRSVRAPTEIMIDPATRVITPVPTNRPLVRLPDTNRYQAPGQLQLIAPPGLPPPQQPPSFYDPRSYGPASSAKPVPPPLPGGAPAVPIPTSGTSSTTTSAPVPTTARAATNAQFPSIPTSSSAATRPRFQSIQASSSATTSPGLPSNPQPSAFPSKSSPTKPSPPTGMATIEETESEETPCRPTNPHHRSRQLHDADGVGI
ncbi:hypothetical protein PSTT_06927 [Puccinia striiformis]|uniref:Uncharacterized protein n=1 Tax=Puccinia striiformis TaxID=27350 RepID=A0A2S4VII1_9BASI|nr:hypothetical protein PSTT_06927 [Puccinia striiformis]